MLFGCGEKVGWMVLVLLIWQVLCQYGYLKDNALMISSLRIEPGI